MSYSKAVTGKQLAGPLGTTSAALGRGPGPAPESVWGWTRASRILSGQCPLRFRNHRVARTTAGVPACAGQRERGPEHGDHGPGSGGVTPISKMGRLRLRCLAVLSRDMGRRLVRTGRSAGGEGTYRKCAVFTHEDLNGWWPRRPLTPPLSHPAAAPPGRRAGVTFQRKAKPLVEPE